MLTTKDWWATNRTSFRCPSVPRGLFVSSIQMNISLTSIWRMVRLCRWREIYNWNTNMQSSKLTSMTGPGLISRAVTSRCIRVTITIRHFWLKTLQQTDCENFLLTLSCSITPDSHYMDKPRLRHASQHHHRHCNITTLVRYRSKMLCLLLHRCSVKRTSSNCI